MCDHLIVCPGLTRTERETFENIVRGRHSKRRRLDEKHPATQPRSAGGGGWGGSAPASKSSAGALQRITSHFQPLSSQQQRRAEQCLANWVYAVELPFRPLEHEHFKTFTQCLNTSFEPPSAELLSGTLLNDRYLEVNEMVMAALSRSAWLSLVTDGWDDAVNNHVVNYMVCTPRPFFVDSRVTGTERQTATNIESDIVRVAALIPDSRLRIAAIVTDNASAPVLAAKQAAATIVRSWNLDANTFKTTAIWVIGCAAHMQQLLLLDIFRAEPAATILAKASRLTAFVNDSYLFGSAFRAHGGHIKTPVATRWGTQVECLRSIVSSRAALNHAATTYTLNGSELPSDINPILQNDEFWELANFLVGFLAPVQQGTLDLQGDKVNLGTVYPTYKRMMEAVESAIADLNARSATRKVPKSFLDAVDKAIRKRLDDVGSSLHFFTHVVDPETAAKNKWVRRPKERWSILDNFLKENLPTDLCMKAHIELAAFLDRTEPFDLTAAWELAASGRVVGATWWRTYFIETAPTLAALAVRALSIPPSSACAERMFSTFGRIHTDKRNQLNHDTVKKLGFISFNERALREYR